MKNIASPNWTKQKCFVKISSPWVTFLGENFEDNDGRLLEYWRVEKPDSVIALTIQGDRFVLPPPSFRPGISRPALDLPGGRIPHGSTPEQVIRNVICRELFIQENDIMEMIPLNKTGWPINSSFSNQCLFAYVANIDPSTKFEKEKGISFFSTTRVDLKKLLHEISCLQCRAVLLEWLLNSKWALI